MRTLATATLLQGPAQLRVCVVRVVALQGDAAPDARLFVVGRSVTELAPPDAADAGTVRSSSESTLTPQPLTQDSAMAKAVDFVRYRVSLGDVLDRQSGFLALNDLLSSSSIDDLPLYFPDQNADTDSSNAQTKQHESSSIDPSPEAAAASVMPPEAPEQWHFPLPPTWQSQRQSPRGEADAIAALVAQFAPERWRLLTTKRQARVVWRVAERFDAARREQPAQQRLYTLVPRLVGLLESSDNLLDYCLAWALARLQDPGAAQALATLAGHGRGEATRALAVFAHRLLCVRTGQGVSTALAPVQAVREVLLQQLGGLAASPLHRQGSQREWDLATVGARTDLASTLLQAQSLALVDTTVHAALCEVLANVRFAPDVYASVRQVYKRAELAQDWRVLAVLHARFEQDRVASPSDLNRMVYQDPDSGSWVSGWHRKAKLHWLYSSGTRDYFLARGLRTVRRLAELGHSEAPQLAVALLRQLPNTPPAPGTHYPQSVYAQGHRWSVAAQLLLGAKPEWFTISHRLRLGNHTYPDTRDDSWSTERLDGLPAMWDANPQAVLQLLRHSGNRLVQWVMARVMRDHMDWLGTLPEAPIADLLGSRFALTADLAIDVVQQHLAQARNTGERLRWWRALARSAHPRAAQVLAQDLAPHLSLLPQAPDLLAALLYSPAASNRALGYSVSPQVFKAAGVDTAHLMHEVLALLPSLDEQLPEVDAITQGLQQWLSGAWGECAPQVPAEPLLALLNDPALPIVQVASTWVSLHPQAMAQLPGDTLRALLTSPNAARQVCGVRLLANLPVPVLREQADLLFTSSQSPDADMRAAVRPAFVRLAADADGAEASAWLAQRLHASLFQSEPADGVWDDTLRLLVAPAAEPPAPLAAFAPGQDADSVWRALQARARGAQQYGALVLPKLATETYTLRQWATLGRHADVAVRARAMASVDQLLDPVAAATPEQADALLPLADSAFENSQQFARQLFGERLPDSALSPELLIRWVDHPQAWVRALGQQRLMRQMSASEASLTLTRLAQHPSAEVQQFVTQWLLALPDEPAPERAARLRQLLPYFLTVLSQVNRGRVSKVRVQAFLRDHTRAPETAAVVAEIYARQVVGAGRLDQPQYMAGLRDIAARHPDVPLPFMQGRAVPSRPGRRPAISPTTAA